MTVTSACAFASVRLRAFGDTFNAGWLSTPQTSGEPANDLSSEQKINEILDLHVSMQKPTLKHWQPIRERKQDRTAWSSTLCSLYQCMGPLGDTLCATMSLGACRVRIYTCSARVLSRRRSMCHRGVVLLQKSKLQVLTTRGRHTPRYVPPCR